MRNFILFLSYHLVLTQDIKANYPSQLFTGKNGAVAADATLCSEVGVDLLKRGGSAVDAAIGATICQGIVYPFASGIGGGGFMLIKDPAKEESIFIDFRETAPALSTPNMFVNSTDGSTFGGLSVAVPGELKGLEAAHKLYGKLPWKVLFESSIELAKEHKAPYQIPMRLQRKADLIKRAPELFAKYSHNGTFIKEGEPVRLPELARTLEEVANNGADVFYRGRIAQHLVNIVKKYNGILSLEDLANYQVNIRSGLKGTYMNQTIHFLPSPSSGPVMYYILKMLETYGIQDQFTPYLAHRLVESFKFGFAARSKLGDPKFVDDTKVVEYLLSEARVHEDSKLITDNITHEPKYYFKNMDPVFGNDPHGTSHVSTLDKWGLSVSVTSTINLEFGSKVLCPNTGVLLNNEMDDFSTPGLTNFFGLSPSPANYIAPGKRPLSSMTPIVIENSDQSFVIGASGGSRIITGVVQTAFNLFQLRQSLKESISLGRLHHQLLPNEIRFEPTGFSSALRASLLARNHTIIDIPSPDSIVNAIKVTRTPCPSPCYDRTTSKLEAVTDLRKNGTAAAY